MLLSKLFVPITKDLPAGKNQVSSTNVKNGNDKTIFNWYLFMATTWIQNNEKNRENSKGRTK